jgi:putative intracellular protease/amidase
MIKTVYIFLFEGFSDWEIGYLTPELKKNENIDLFTFSKTGAPVRSMGGLKVSPDLSLEKLRPEEITTLILPGGDAWETGSLNYVEDLVRRLNKEGKTIAAICAATTFLGRLGMLNAVQHTSNGLDYLKYIVPNYLGDKNYSSALAVRDQNLITAAGIAPIEFAREIFLALDLRDVNYIRKWFQLFKEGVWEN